MFGVKCCGLTGGFQFINTPVKGLDDVLVLDEIGGKKQVQQLLHAGAVINGLLQLGRHLAFRCEDPAGPGQVALFQEWFWNTHGTFVFGITELVETTKGTRWSGCLFF